MKFRQIVIIILLIAGLVVGISIWQPWKDSSRTVEVTGEGKIMAEPDIAKITAGVQTEKSTADEAQNEASMVIARVVEAVKEKDIADKDIQTQTISTSPKYEYSSGNSTISGYYARVTVTVTIRDISKGQGVLDAATGAGANLVYGPQLTFSDERLSGLKTQAQKKAVENAREKAGELATASNLKIGKIMNVSEKSTSYKYQYPEMSYRAMETLASSPSSQSLYVGEDGIIMSVDAKFALK